MNPTTPTPSDRPCVTYVQAQAILADRGIYRSIRTLERWVERGILSIGRVTARTVFLFRDEVVAVTVPEDPEEQRMESARSVRNPRRSGP